MITRIEIDGFKSFVDFELDVPQFLVVMGGNASGKSNLVDALTLLADSWRYGEMLDAGLVSNRGVPAEFFHQYENGARAESLRIAVRATDDPAGPMTSLVARLDPNGRIHDVEARVAFPRRKPPSWVSLGVVPTAMRGRGLFTDRRPLQPDGGNLASVLGRLTEAGDDSWQWLLADAVALLPELHDIRVARNGDFWDLSVRSRGSGWTSVRAASDGTLRVLAMLAAAHDPEHASLLLIDEVENGLHPSRLTELIRRLRSITEASSSAEQSKQMILTTHSPVVLSALYPEHENEVVFLSTAYGPRTVNGEKVGSERTVAEPVGRTGLPRAEVRGLLSTVRPMEP